MGDEQLLIYLGTKAIYARFMTKEEYCIYRGWGIPENEDPKEKGFLVEYIDSTNSNHADHKGYISWSPEEVFNKAYKPGGSYTFGQAVDFGLKKGLEILRSSWIHKNAFIFQQVPAEIGENVIPNMQSLPQNVKDTFALRNNGVGLKQINYSNQIAYVDSQNNISGWNPSIEDILAEDWIINFNQE